MAGALVGALGLVRDRGALHVKLAADDGFYAQLDGGEIEIHRAVHVAVVGNGHGGVLLLRQFQHEFRRPAFIVPEAQQPVEKGKFAVIVQMYKLCFSHKAPYIAIVT